ncbi:MAG: aldo/keto reductase [bacterium]|nr:aldo/keto reductase [bacterium]
MPALGFGTAPLGGLYEPVDFDEAVTVVRGAVDHGYRYFDTAPLYGYGAAERILGDALVDISTDVTISTKVGRVVDEAACRPAGDMFVGSRGDAVFDFSADGVRRSLEASFGRLQRTFVDVVFIHDPDDHARQALDEAYPALEQLRAEGAVGAIGVGMNQPCLPTRFIRETDIDAVLVAGRYTLLDRTAERELFPAARARGVHVVAAGVYNSGVLTGAETTPHFDYAPASPSVVARVRALREICERHDVDIATAAVQLAARHAAVSTVLIGARSKAEAILNRRHIETPIPEELWKEVKMITGELSC